MKILSTMVAVLAMAFAANASSLVEAQGPYSNGYGFGLGFGSGIEFTRPDRDLCHGNNLGIGFLPLGGIGFAPRVEEPPYFAKFPPVYYSNIVRRPYGVSPYAAPAGITPVEMQYATPPAAPVTVSNPYFRKDLPVAADTNRNSEPMLRSKESEQN